MPRHLALIVAVAAFAVAAAVASTGPSQIHIAFAGGSATATPNRMMISWHTEHKTATSVVKLGTSPGNYTQRFNSTDVAHYLVTFHHHVSVGPLKPDTRYYYVCGDETAGWSQEYSFVSAADHTRRSFKMAVWGDLGTGSDGNAVDTFNFLRKSHEWSDFKWHVGDIGYANNDFLHDLKDRYEVVYNQYMDGLQNMTATRAYMVLPGNHEAECHSPACFLNKTLLNTLRNFTAYNARFRMPSRESGGIMNMWYSFNYASAHFVNFNTETDFKDAPLHDYGDSRVIPAGHFAPNDDVQIEWLENDLRLAAADRASGKRPWIFMGGHRPIYTKKGSIVVEQREAVEDLMNKYGVDIYFTGHSHLYVRTWPVYRDKIENSYENPDKVVHLTVGGAGCDEYKAPNGARSGSVSIERTAAGRAAAAAAAAPFIAAMNDDKYTTGIVEVHDDNHLTFTVYDSKTAAIVDQFKLFKQH